MADVATANYYGELVGRFLEATVHEILHLRSIYSQELFTRHRLYSVMVRKSRHPQLNEYIRSVVQSMQARPLPSVPHPDPAAAQQAEAWGRWISGR